MRPPSCNLQAPPPATPSPALVQKINPPTEHTLTRDSTELHITCKVPFRPHKNGATGNTSMIACSPTLHGLLTAASTHVIAGYCTCSSTCIAAPNFGATFPQVLLEHTHPKQSKKLPTPQVRFGVDLLLSGRPCIPPQTTETVKNAHEKTPNGQK